MEVAVNGEEESFAYCENLEEVWIPSNVKYIRNSTFRSSPKVVKKDYSYGETPDIDTGGSSGGGGTGTGTPYNEWIDGK